MRIKENIFMNQKGFAPIFIIFIAVAVLLMSSFIASHYAQKEASFSSVATRQGGEYKNTLVGYELTYKPPWRIAVEYSKRLSVLKKAQELYVQAGCAWDFKEQSLFLEEATECFSKNPGNKELQNQFVQDQINWRPENSEIIALTDLSRNEEATFIADVQAGKKTILDFPFGHIVDIYPVDFGPFLKEGHLSNLDVKIITLPDGTKASQTIGTSSGRHISVIIPHVFNYTLWSSSAEQKFRPAKSLLLSIDADQGSPAEKALSELVNSVRFP